MTPLSRLYALALDVETGGLDPQTDALLAIGLAVVVSGEVVSSASVRVRPAAGLRITPEAVAVNGWRSVEAGDVSEPHAVASAHEAVMDLLQKAPTGARLCLLGHNVEFDAGFLRAAAARCGLPDPLAPFGHRYIDSCALAALPELLGHLPEGRSLDALCRQLGVERGARPHQDPLDDALASWRCARAIVERYGADSVAAAKARWPYRARREAAVMAAMRAAAPAHKDLPMPPTGDDDAG